MAENITLQTPKFDARFPNTNQTRNCWQNYVDFQKCRAAKGDDYQPCQHFKRVYKSLCPVSWVREREREREREIWCMCVCVCGVCECE